MQVYKGETKPWLSNRFRMVLMLSPPYLVIEGAAKKRAVAFMKQQSQH
jgi:hypothetical protein